MLAKTETGTPNATAPAAMIHAPRVTTAGARADIDQGLRSSRMVRLSIQSILHYAKRGAQDLHKGHPWSNSLERFETMSMEQARALATFPITSEHPRFGAAVRQARLAFIEFRETVRREAISIIEPDIQEEILDTVLDTISGKAETAVRKLELLESSLAAA